MLRVTLLFLFACLTCALAQRSIPDTPAGHSLQAWLDAFNSADKAKVQAFVSAYDPARSVDNMLAFRRQTGGFDLLSVEAESRTDLTFRVREKGGTTEAMGHLTVKDAEPAMVVSFSVRAVPPGAPTGTFKIDAAVRDRVIDGAMAKLNEYYVFPEIGRKMEAAVREHQKKGDYNSITNGDTLATRLTDDMREVSHDKHLHVRFSPAAFPPGEPGHDPQMMTAMRKELEQDNCGFEKVERLPQNIGYLKFNMFADPNICGPTAIAAMNFLGHVDALIVDLRDNGGGEPSMVALITSYLFDEPTHLNDLYNRKEDKTTQYWTLPYVPGPTLAGKPVFVVTSSHTFSGAEEFSYNLKNLKRATIIGETTGGGAHPVEGHRIDDHFMIGVPFARAINPISKTNWEGKGVEPDVKAPDEEALAVAKKMAADAVKKK
jgi:hypothetical protein